MPTLHSEHGQELAGSHDPALDPGAVVRTRFRGYAPDEVDAFLDRCAVALGAAAASFPELASLRAVARPVTAEEVEQVQFGGAFRGYETDEVDDLLDRVAAVLRGHPSG